MKAQIFLHMINPGRYNNKLHWLDIGRALFSNYEGSDEGLTLWIEATKNACNIDKTIKCKKLYPNFDSSHITIKTLAWYARCDSPEKYSRWHDVWCRKKITRAFNGNTYDIAIALYSFLWLDYCYSFEDQAWYKRKYENTEWVKHFGPHKFISTTFTVTFIKLLNESNNGVDFRKKSRLIAKLQTVPFKYDLIREARQRFCVDNIMSN
jgi:hypothetical protein